MVNTDYLPRETDVLIVGGGPAGLATALAVRQKGLRAVVIDSAQPPIDKACGEGLMPDSVAALAKLGVTINPSRLFAFKGIRFIAPQAQVEANFPYGTGLGVRRLALHETLVEHATDAGVHLAWQQRISEVRDSYAFVNDQPITYRWIVGADGGNSIMRRWSGLEIGEKVTPRYGFRRHYRVRPWTEFMELHWGEECQIYVTPVNNDEVCVALISRDPQLRLDEALPRFPAIVRHLQGAEPVNLERGGISATRALRAVQKDRLALVGDASGSVDAITGEGLCLAFRQSIALADAIGRNDLSLYEAAHRDIRFRPAMMAQMLLLMDRYPALQSRALRALSNRPRVFARMLATHVGAASASDIAANIFELGWSILNV